MHLHRVLSEEIPYDFIVSLHRFSGITQPRNFFKSNLPIFSLLIKTP